MSMNQLIIEGNLIKEPELKSVGNNTVLNFGIAYNTRTKDAGGNWVDGQPMFFDVEFWPKDPQYWAQRLTKGTSVVVFGSLKYESWQKDGTNMHTVRIKANELKYVFLPTIDQQKSMKGGTTTSTPQQQYHAPVQQPAAQVAPQQEEYPSDIPF